jgi:hypothetical protein
LATVVLSDSYALPGAAVALQRLLSLPTIRRVHLLTRAAFLPIWDHLTPNVLHLRLHCMTDAPKPLQITQPRSPAIIAPKSLSLGFMYNIRDWLENDLCPLDFSRLTVLSVETDTSIFCWPRMLPAHQTIQALEFTSLSSNVRFSYLLPFEVTANAQLDPSQGQARQISGKRRASPSSQTCCSSACESTLHQRQLPPFR